MDLDRVQTQKNHTQRGKQTRGGKWNPKKAKRFKDRACLGYRKKGHFIKDYKSKEVKVVDIRLIDTNKPTPWIHIEKETELIHLFKKGLIPAWNRIDIDKSIIYTRP